MGKSLIIVLIILNAGVWTIVNDIDTANEKLAETGKTIIIK